MTVLPAADRPFLRDWLRFFGLRGVRVTRVDTPHSDISVRLPASGEEMPELLLGRKWRAHRAENAGLARAQLAHEGLHVAGAAHNAYMRRNHFWAYNRRRDALSAAVMQDIQRGTRHFDPHRFGLDPARMGRPERGSR